MKKKKKIIIGTRGSKLALIYAKKAKNEIKKFKNKFNIDQIEIQKIKTQGDVKTTFPEASEGLRKIGVIQSSD